MLATACINAEKNFEFGNFRKDPTVDEHPTLCVKQSMNREQLEREKSQGKGEGRW